MIVVVDTGVGYAEYLFIVKEKERDILKFLMRETPPFSLPSLINVGISRKESKVTDSVSGEL